ncbi:hypothetical protein [Saccharothrix obliqua]|uniref:hypothetical protein n=1 Tax=Saccharothrix obliqua TaxID=2861747 RepID=UPI001C5F3AB8|nr:hypothetical protein [Saccharothrix obliqua]MBW4721193.1 hypothetical protein [Saccharothrix obliqua]
MSRIAPVLLLLALAGCGQHVSTASDGMSTNAPVVTTVPAPTSVPPNGACQVRVEIPEPMPPADPPVSGSRAPADMPPNHVDNRSWRVRKELRPDVRAAAAEVAGQVRPGLQNLCDKGDFSPQATKAVFTTAGRPEVWLTGMSTPGVVFVLTMENPQGTGCVFGHLHPGLEDTPGQLLIAVNGTTREGSCYEPPSH